MNKMREQFEAWLHSNGKDDRDLQRCAGYATIITGSDYSWGDIEAQWKAWKACAALASVSAGQEKPVATYVGVTYGAAYVIEWADGKSLPVGTKLFAHPAPAAPQQCAKLPELPDYAIGLGGIHAGSRREYYTASQMREYGKACAEEAQQVPAVALSWNQLKAITDESEVHDTLQGFSEDPTLDNAVCVVRAIIAATTQGDKQ